MNNNFLFRASSFGRHACDIYSGQVLGHRLDQTDNMLRGLLAEQMLRTSHEELMADYKIIPSVLAGTGYKRWAEYDAAHGIDRETDKLVPADVWSEAIAASDCLAKAMHNLGYDPNQAEYQGQYTLELTDLGLVAGKRTDGITCTTDFVWRDMVIDTKVLSKPLDADYIETYKWQLSVQKLATQREKAGLLCAVQYGDKWVAHFVQPQLYNLVHVRGRSIELVNEITSLLEINK